MVMWDVVIIVGNETELSLGPRIFRRVFPPEQEIGHQSIISPGAPARAERPVPGRKCVFSDLTKFQVQRQEKNFNSLAGASILPSRLRNSGTDFSHRSFHGWKWRSLCPPRGEGEAVGGVGAYMRFSADRYLYKF